VQVLIMKGAGGKAFCAGGDIRAIYDNKKAGKQLPTLTVRCDPPRRR
jgi:enoyl-CoA hydratase/carnithine racemase